MTESVWNVRRSPPGARSPQTEQNRAGKRDMEKDSHSIEVWVRIAVSIGESGEAPSYTLTVKGNSMYPFIRSGIDSVTVEPVGKRKLKRGDIILFPGQANGLSYILHRIYRLDGEYICTLGDGNLCPDGWIPRTSVCGVAVAIKRGAILLMLDSPWMRAIAECWMWLLGWREILLACISRIGRMRGNLRRIRR